MRVKLIISPLAKKKYRVIFENGKKIDFGAKGYEDYTTSKDPIKQKNYLARHYKRENWLDPYTAGFWAKWLLWSRPDINDAISDIKKIFNIEIYA